MGQLSFSHLTDDPKYLQEMEDLWNDTIGADSKGISGQDVAWNPNDETKRTYQVKGYVDSATGEFIFDPAGNKTQTYKDPMGNELKLTQKEFAERWFAEQAIQNFGPKVDRIESSSKASKDSGGFMYKVDAGIKAQAPIISGRFDGKGANFKLVEVDGVQEYQLLQTKSGVTMPNPAFSIPLYKKNKKGEDVLNLTRLRTFMGGETKDL